MKGLAPARHKSKITALLAAWKAVFNWQFRPQDTTKVLFEFFFFKSRTMNSARDKVVLNISPLKSIFEDQQQEMESRD